MGSRFQKLVPEPIPSHHGLEAFLSKLPWENLQEAALPHFNGDRASAAAFLMTLQAEARYGLNLIQPQLGFKKRILEVGSGMGLLSGYLETLGYDITAMEPGMGGFGISPSLAKAVSGGSGFASLRRLDIPAHCLDPDKHGLFDFIYSVNVLEHIPELEESINALANVLSGNGIMMHSCPNYFVPYEPHFGIPLVPLAPHLTAIFTRGLKTSELWQSLNFISAPKVKRICRRHNLAVHFEPAVMLNTFLRLEDDMEFRRRQGNSGLLSAYRILKKTRLLPFLGNLPATWCTPMIFQIFHEERPPAAASMTSQER